MSGVGRRLILRQGASVGHLCYRQRSRLREDARGIIDRGTGIAAQADRQKGGEDDAKPIQHD